MTAQTRLPDPTRLDLTCSFQISSSDWRWRSLEEANGPADGGALVSEPLIVYPAHVQVVVAEDKERNESRRETKRVSDSSLMSSSWSWWLRFAQECEILLLSRRRVIVVGAFIDQSAAANVIREDAELDKLVGECGGEGEGPGGKRGYQQS